MITIEDHIQALNIHTTCQTTKMYTDIDLLFSLHSTWLCNRSVLAPIPLPWPTTQPIHTTSPSSAGLAHQGSSWSGCSVPPRSPSWSGPGDPSPSTTVSLQWQIHYHNHSLTWPQRWRTAQLSHLLQSLLHGEYIEDGMGIRKGLTIKCVHTHTHVCADGCMSMCVDVWEWACMCICVLMSVRVWHYVCARVHVFVCVPSSTSKADIWLRVIQIKRKVNHSGDCHKNC